MFGAPNWICNKSATELPIFHDWCFRRLMKCKVGTTIMGWSSPTLSTLYQMSLTVVYYTLVTHKQECGNWQTAFNSWVVTPCSKADRCTVCDKSALYQTSQPVVKRSASTATYTLMWCPTRQPQMTRRFLIFSSNNAHVTALTTPCLRLKRFMLVATLLLVPLRCVAIVTRQSC